jgi:hypothetical protein
MCGKAGEDRPHAFQYFAERGELHVGAANDDLYADDGDGKDFIDGGWGL